MRKHNWMFGVGLFALAAVPCHAEGLKSWTFDRNSGREGWSVPEQMTGVVMGGSLWLTPTPKERDPEKLSSLNYQIYGDYNIVKRLKAGEKAKTDGPSNAGELSIAGPADLNIASPGDLALTVTERGDAQLLVKVRLLNLSPLNNIDLKWRAKADTPNNWSSKRCSVKPDLKQWQEIACYIDRHWTGIIDQIALGISENVMRGDIWIDSIQIEVADPEPIPVRPDVASTAVVARISVPGLSQDEFADAFKVLDECLVVDVPAYGFPYPFMKASGDRLYGDYAWPYGDTALTAAAAAWVNQEFAENVMRGTAEIQSVNPDGRISGYPWEPFMGQPADNNIRPDGFFDSAYVIASRTQDGRLRAMIYETMRKYLDWWLSPTKRDSSTGLIMGDWEEAANFPLLNDGFEPKAQSRAPVDLNATIVVAADLTADVAADLGRNEEAARYRKSAEDLKSSINVWMWNETDGFYQDYDMRHKQLATKATAQAFFALRHGIALKARQERLIAHLIDPAQFNWGHTPPITNSKRTDEQDGKNGVLALTTKPVIAGLEESGQFDLAAELNWQVLRTFGKGFREGYLATGEGMGGKRFGFTAAAYIEGVISQLFGIEYLGANDRVRIVPKIPKALYGQEIAINGLILPTGRTTRLSVRVKQDSQRTARIAVSISGQLPKGNLEMGLPGSGEAVSVPARHSYTANFQ